MVQVWMVVKREKFSLTRWSFISSQLPGAPDLQSTQTKMETKMGKTREASLPQRGPARLHRAVTVS